MAGRAADPEPAPAKTGEEEATVDWRTWLRAAVVEGVDAERGITVTDSSMLLRAAVAGQGVALARSVLAADEIATDRLVRPFDVEVPAEFAYYLAYPEERAEQPNMAAFREWTLEETRIRPRATDPLPRIAHQDRRV